jgi:hypothetical protein
MESQQRKLFLVYSLNTVSNKSVSIRPIKPLYFSDIEKAKDVISKFKEFYSFLYDEESQDEHVYCIVLEEFELDSPYRYQLSTRVYSPDGELLGDCIVPDDGPFLGRSKNLIYYEKGEVVELPHGDQLIFGIIVGQPMCFNENANVYGLTASDDCYTVIHHNSLEVDYAHAPMVFKPTREVSKEVRAELLYAFQQITNER